VFGWYFGLELRRRRNGDPSDKRLIRTRLVRLDTAAEPTLWTEVSFFLSVFIRLYPFDYRYAVAGLDWIGCGLC
jgi:hypothetical protein